MTKIKITQPIMNGGKLVKVGEIIEVDNGLANNLQLRGRAVLVADKPATDKADGKK